MRWRTVPFLVVGALTGSILLVSTLRTHPTARVGSCHLASSFGPSHGILVVGLDTIATCGSMLASGFRLVLWFGISNLVAIVILARLPADGFTSLWCFDAALAGGAVALYLRRGYPRAPVRRERAVPAGVARGEDLRRVTGGAVTREGRCPPGAP